MSPNKVLIVNKTFPVAGLEILKKKAQVKVLHNKDHCPQFLTDVKTNLEGVNAIIWNTKYHLTTELLDLAGPSLKVVSTVSSGLDHVDVEALKKRSILLGNVPKVLDNSVADVTVGLLIAAARQFKEGIQEVESGKWKFGIQWRLGQDVAGSTVGVVGLGGIGQAVIRRLKGFDVARFVYCGRSDKPEAKELGVERMPLEQLLRESDYVILCCPLTNETKHIINAKSLNIMKNTAVIVNVGRGELIDQEALYVALKEKRIFAAGADVVTPEPLPKDHPLVKLSNFLVLPHIGSATVATRDAMARIAANNIVLALEGQRMQFPVLEY